jgi:hypothetical protein
MASIRRHYASVMATIALFIALGGGAYAVTTAPENSVVSKSIKNGQVKRRDLAKKAVNGAKVADNSLNGKDINEHALGRVPSAATANHATSADNATQLGGLNASAFEHADQIKRFGPLEDATPTEDGPTASFGPFSFQLFCQFGGEGADIVGVASSEPHAVVTWIFPFDDGTVRHFYTNDQGSAAINMANSSKPGAYSKPVEGWALSRSGFRMHFSLWFGRGILGADNSTCSFGGEFRRG